MSKFTRIMMLALCLMATMAAPALAQDVPPTNGPAPVGQPWTLINLGATLGVGLTVIGAAAGIGKLASSALESMARQPEVAGNIQTAMIIAAALIEGFTFYALFICSGKV